MIGNPEYKREDIVNFNAIDKNQIGIIAIETDPPNIE